MARSCDTSEGEDRAPLLAHRELLVAIAARAGLDPPDAAKQPAETVLVGIARRLDDSGREALEEALPDHLSTLVRGSAKLNREEGKTAFLETVASKLDTSPE